MARALTSSAPSKGGPDITYKCHSENNDRLYIGSYAYTLLNQILENNFTRAEKSFY